MENNHETALPIEMIVHFIEKHRKNPGITKIQIRELAKSAHSPDPLIIEAIKKTDFYKNKAAHISDNQLFEK